MPEFLEQATSRETQRILGIPFEWKPGVSGKACVVSTSEAAAPHCGRALGAGGQQRRDPGGQASGQRAGAERLRGPAAACSPERDPMHLLPLDCLKRQRPFVSGKLAQKDCL